MKISTVCPRRFSTALYLGSGNYVCNIFCEINSFHERNRFKEFKKKIFSFLTFRKINNILRKISFYKKIFHFDLSLYYYALIQLFVYTYFSN